MTCALCNILGQFPLAPGLTHFILDTTVTIVVLDIWAHVLEIMKKISLKHVKVFLLFFVQLINFCRI